MTPEREPGFETVRIPKFIDIDSLDKALLQAIDPITRLLFEGGVVDETAIRRGLQTKSSPDEAVSVSLLRQRLVTEKKYFEAAAKASSLEFVDLDIIRFDPQFSGIIKQDVAIRDRLVPIRERSGQLLIATDLPAQGSSVDDLAFTLSRNVKVVLATTSQVSARLPRAVESPTPNKHIGRTENVGRTANVEVLINRIFTQAIEARASDIQFLPSGNDVKIRLRVDGSWRELYQAPILLEQNLASRVKVMAGSPMDPSKRLVCQDGRIEYRHNNISVDCRVSVYPVKINGKEHESVVIRLLDKTQNVVQLKSLGLNQNQTEIFDRIIHQPQGLVVLAGPTGSGKTTTLYAALGERNDGSVNIVTVEDPIEYTLDGLAQATLNTHHGQDFDTLAKSIVRQAPDIVLIGEVRDSVTATASARMAETGHLVFTTIHARDSVGAISRFTSLDVAAAQLADTLTAVISQRLVRKLCTDCSTQIKTPTEAEYRVLGLSPEQNGDTFISEPCGCSSCNYSGYRGRVAVFEILEIDDHLRDMIAGSARSTEIRAAALEKGRLHLLEDDIREKVLHSKTSVAEFARLTGKRLGY